MDPSTAILFKFCMLVTVLKSPVVGRTLYWPTLAQFVI